jgi:hypothetical protein
VGTRFANPVTFKGRTETRRRAIPPRTRRHNAVGIVVKECELSTLEVGPVGVQVETVRDRWSEVTSDLLSFGITRSFKIALRKLKSEGAAQG